jgi:hypothetical protein
MIADWLVFRRRTAPPSRAAGCGTFTEATFVTRYDPPVRKILPCSAAANSVGSTEGLRRCSEHQADVTVPATDILIAACARRHGAELEHADRDFDAIASVSAGR